MANTLTPLFSIRSSSFLQVIRTFIGMRMSAIFSKIRRPTAELVTLERLKKICIMFYVVNPLAPSFLLELHFCRFCG